MSPAEASRFLRGLAALAPVIPVIEIDDPDQARPLAEALVAGGLPVLEVTLRTPTAFSAITAMAGVPGAVVGAGTLLDAGQVTRAVDAGARFGVSPGATDALLDATEAADLPLLPGAVTATEAMRLAARGHDFLKFFPASASGGVAVLKALGAPLPRIGFCPTGGITPQTAPDYLGLPNVLCVGGSWVVPGKAVETGAWDDITALARAAAALRT